MYSSITLTILALVPVSLAITNYEYYTSAGIKSGLSADQPYFTLNGRNITIYSGSIHYFRVPKAYWQDRLRKLRALGFNTVETYIAWNLHEPEQGVYDFGSGPSDMSDFLNLTQFIQLAQQEDLFMIIRSGPFICAEFEFGGYPSWLLREAGIQLRRHEKSHLQHVGRWFNTLMPILAQYQFTKGGPIIALQVENEFASIGDSLYLRELRDLMLSNGIVELLVTSDNPWKGTRGSIPDLFLMTGNFNSNGTGNLVTMDKNQPGKPRMVMEFWSGWFDYWGQCHQTTSLADFQDVYTQILSYPASVNIYMFIGGTNFQFLSGSENLKFDDFNTKFSPITTSYDYDALLQENGDYTSKYYAAKELIARYSPNPSTNPEIPALTSRVAYDNITISQQIPFGKFVRGLPCEQSSNVISMENMDINNGNGQSYGYIVYSKNLDLPAGSILKIMGRVCDTVIVLVNGQRISPKLSSTADLNKFGTWRVENSTLTLNNQSLTNATLDLLVENWGRVNVGVYRQFKGLWQGDVMVNDVALRNWTLSALEFKKSWIKNLDIWENVDHVAGDIDEPTLFKAVLNVDDPKDSYVYMEKWTKGLVIVNGFVLGRYARMGPQQALYLPGPFLRKGTNDVVIFEHFAASEQVEFVTDVVYKVY